MKLKTILGIAAVAVVGIVGAATIAIRSIDLEDVRALIISNVEAATGRSLRIEGPLRFVLSLRPALAAENITLSNASWGGRPDMIIPSFNRVEIEKSVIVLHDGVTGDSRRIDIDELRLAADEPGGAIALALKGELDGQSMEVSGTFGSMTALRSNDRLPIDLAGRFGESELNVTGILTPPLDHRNYAIELSATGANLSDLGRLIRVDLPAWRNYSIAAKLKENGDVLSFEDIQAKVGRSDATGHLTLDVGVDRPRMDGALAATLIDLSDLDESRESSSAADDDSRIFSDKPLPYRWMNSFDSTLTLSIGKMVKGEAAFTDLKADATLRNGKLKIADGKAKASGGSIVVSGSVDGAKNTPVLVLTGQAHQVDAGNLLQMLDLSDVLRGGTADIAIEVSSQGKSLHQIMAGLAGTASWSMVGGAINDNFARILLADLSGVLRTGSGGGQLTCLAARFTAKAGVASTRGLVVDTPAASIFGSGAVDLGRETIDMRFEPSAKQTSLAALAVPVDVTGPLADPSVTPDPLGVAGTAIGAVSTVAGDVFDVLGEVTGAGSSGSTGGGCAMALDASAKSKPAKQKSTGEKILDDTGDVIEDIGKGIGDLFQ